MSSQATPAQLLAERKVAELNSKLHSAESRVRQLTDECRRLKAEAEDAGDKVRRHPVITTLILPIYADSCKRLTPCENAIATLAD